MDCLREQINPHEICLSVVGRLDKGHTGFAGGSLASKPAWSNTSGCSTTPVFLASLTREDHAHHKLTR